MQPAPKMLLLSSPVVLTGLSFFLPANSLFTLPMAILPMRAVVAVNKSCYIVLIIHIENCKHDLTFLTRGEQQVATLPFDLQLQHGLTEILEMY